jgi:hypothetical protein
MQAAWAQAMTQYHLTQITNALRQFHFVCFLGQIYVIRPDWQRFMFTVSHDILRCKMTRRATPWRFMGTFHDIVATAAAALEEQNKGRNTPLLRRISPRQPT